MYKVMTDSGGMLIGACPASYAGNQGLLLHDGTAGHEYAMRLAEGLPDYDPQGSFGMHVGWRWCKKCQGLFYAKNGNRSVCPAGGNHDGSAGRDLALRSGEGCAGTELGWRWCRKCQGLFCAFFDLGACPAGGTHAVHGLPYFMRVYKPSPPDHLDFPPDPNGKVSIVLDGGVPVGARSHMVIRQDGAYSIVWEIENTGIIGYNYSIACGIKDCWGVLYTFPEHTGHLPGSLESGQSKEVYPQNDKNDLIAKNWSDLAEGATPYWQLAAGIDLVYARDALIAAAGLVLAIVALK
jgi:hypothetical protein